MSVGGVRSKTYTPSSGIPQGSDLGPLLFNIFVTDVAPDIQHSHLLQYAGDIKLSKVVSSPPDCALLQRDIDHMTSWCLRNKLQINSAKTKIYHFCAKAT